MFFQQTVEKIAGRVYINTIYISNAKTYMELKPSK